MNDLVALLITAVYGLGVFVVVEALRRRRGWDHDITRKCVHALLGTWTLPAYALFHSSWWVIAGPLIFLAANIGILQGWCPDPLGLRRHISTGSVLFPVAIVVLVLSTWNSAARAAGAVGLMALAWADPLAYFVGTRWGEHRFLVFGYVKSAEGAVAALLGGFLASLLTLLALSQATPETAFVCAFACAWTAAVFELTSPRGWDNLTLPLAASLVAYVLLT